MATGLAIPVGVGPHGGAALSDGEENDKKIILLALGSDDSEHAWQQNVGLGDEIVFSLGDASVRSLVTRRLIAIFDRFRLQQRFILRPETIRWVEKPATQELELYFKYVSIETDEEKNFRHSFRASGGV